MEKVPGVSLAPLSEILTQLAPLLGAPEGEVVPLEGGITNHNFLATLGGERYVLRLPGKDTDQLGVDRAHERECGEAAARIGVGPRVAELLTDPPCLVTAYVDAAPMTPEELREPATLAAVGALLGRLHGSGERVAASFDSFRLPGVFAERARARGAEIPAAYEPALESAARIGTALASLDREPVFCHDDLLAANFLSTEADGMKLVDWEYAGMGSRYFDLGNFAVNNGLGPDQESAFLAAYFGRPAAPRELAALRLMRFMSDFREAMWGALQGAISELDFDFGAYAAKHFERLAAAEARPEFGTWIGELSGTAG